MSRSARSGSAGDCVRYRRNRFSTRLPVGHLYTRSHFWLSETSPGLWRIGLTRFATRMLGDIVEFDFEIETGRAVAVADVIGWIEGFKAVSDLFCVAEGVFEGANAAAVADPDVIRSATHGDGWLYGVKGSPDPQALDVDGYVGHLDRTIDAMLARPWQTPEIGGA